MNGRPHRQRIRLSSNQSSGMQLGESMLVVQRLKYRNDSDMR